MTGNKFAIIAGLLAAVTIPLGCGKKTPAVDPQKLKAFAPILPMVPASAGPNAERVELGKMLYYDARLSKSQTVSCNSCHPLSAYGAEPQATSQGYRKQHGARNAPSVYNAAMQSVQFWDGRAPDVEAQAKGPLLNPVEMAMPSERAVIAVLNSMPEYVSAFRRAFPGERNPVTLKHVSEAIGAFERGLVTPARCDEFLAGNQSALTPAEKAGFNEFMAAGCAGCHSGTLVGGGTLQKLGVAQPYPDTSDPGRYKITGKETDRMTFKVPSLRNVEMTGPYFHNGKVSTLAEAVELMGTHQTGKQLKPEQTNAIVNWLGSLTGNIPTDYIRQPALPQATARTPKPIA